MQRFTSHPPTLVDQSIAQQPFHRAAAALDALRNSVSFNIADRFQGNEPADFPPANAYGLVPLSGASVVGGVWAGTAGFSLLGIAILATTPLWFIAPAIYVACKRRPTSQLNDTCKTLLAAASALPKKAKVRARQFAAGAKQVFILARISVVQEAIAAGHRLSPRQLHRLERKGLKLIDRAAADLHWNSAKSGQLRAAFKAGQLPRPQEYTRVLDGLHERAQGAIEASKLATVAASAAPSQVAAIQHAGSHPRLPSTACCASGLSV